MCAITANHIFLKFKTRDLCILWLFKFLVIFIHYTNHKEHHHVCNKTVYHTLVILCT
jgi:hypothetical protein